MFVYVLLILRLLNVVTIIVESVVGVFAQPLELYLSFLTHESRNA